MSASTVDKSFVEKQLSFHAYVYVKRFAWLTGMSIVKIQQKVKA